MVDRTGIEPATINYTLLIPCIRSQAELLPCAEDLHSLLTGCYVQLVVYVDYMLYQIKLPIYILA